MHHLSAVKYGMQSFLGHNAHPQLFWSTNAPTKLTHDIFLVKNESSYILDFNTVLLKIIWKLCVFDKKNIICELVLQTCSSEKLRISIVTKEIMGLIFKLKNINSFKLYHDWFMSLKTLCDV